MYCDIRANEICTIKDYANNNNAWINMGVDSSDPKFTNPEKSRSLLFEKGSYLYLSSAPAFSGTFTICMWHKFVSSPFVNDANRLILGFNDGTKIDYTFPTTTSGWKHISFVRDKDNVVTLRINGTTVYTGTNSATIDFSNSNSYLYIGNENKYAYGYKSIIDELIMLDTTLFGEDYTLPEVYFIVNLYIAYLKYLDGLLIGYKK